jgi:hypothetical protein
LASIRVPPSGVDGPDFTPERCRTSVSLRTQIAVLIGYFCVPKSTRAEEIAVDSFSVEECRHIDALERVRYFSGQLLGAADDGPMKSRSARRRGDVCGGRKITWWASITKRSRALSANTSLGNGVDQSAGGRLPVTITLPAQYRPQMS